MVLDIVRAGSQNLGGWSECLSRLRSRCGAVRIFAHGDHWKPRVLVLQSRLFVTGARDRRCLTPKCSFRGGRSTLDMVVIAAMQWKNQGVSCEHFYALSATPRHIVLLPALLKEKSALDDCCLSIYTLTLDLSALDNDFLFLWIFHFSVRIVCSNLHLTFYFVLAGATLPTSMHFYFLLLRARGCFTSSCYHFL